MCSNRKKNSPRQNFVSVINSTTVVWLYCTEHVNINKTVGERYIYNNNPSEPLDEY